MTSKQQETYQKWKDNVNMTKSELQKFYDSDEGKKAGLSPKEANRQGIDYGRESARWILKMKDTPVSEWTDAMWKWAGKQNSFISRMSGMEGKLYNDKGVKTRKHLSLLIWGHNPEKKAKGGKLSSLEKIKKESESLINIEPEGLYEGGLDAPFFKKGGITIAQTPAPAKDRIYGSKVNKRGSAESKKTAKDIKFSPKVIESLNKKVSEFNESNKDKVDLETLKAVYRRGAGAYSVSHRPTITGGVPNTRNAWAMARVNKFLKKKAGEKVKLAYVQDDDLLAKGGTTKTLLAPNGQPSNLTPEQWHLVRTPEFKAWFGDWENDPKNASKVVDENGEPLICYHGTLQKFNVFNTYFDNDTWHGKGAYFTSSLKDLYTNYVTYKEDIYLICFLNLKNPLIVGKKDESSWFEKKDREIILKYLRLFRFPRVNYAYENSWDSENLEKIVRSEFPESQSGKLLNTIYRELGFDGIIFLSPNKLKGHKAPLKTKHFVAFQPNQIKLADGSNTTFDPNNPDIRFAEGGSTSILLAPNGKPSNLTPEQYRLVRTQEFKNWFGDWENEPENASKVVDANGEPLVVYHGTNNDFNVFDKNRGIYRGFYFTAYKEYSYIVKYTKKILTCFLSIKNPPKIEPLKMGLGRQYVVWNNKFLALSFLDIKKDEYDKIKSLGFDGLIGNIKDGDYELPNAELVVFEPNQIKLADGSNTTFDPNNPDIRFELGGVYHGSPYTFDRFSTEKIGTGEGAAAFGWGLYFTDLDNIARTYAETLSKFNPKIDGVEYRDIPLSKGIYKLFLTQALERGFGLEMTGIQGIKNIPKIEFNKSQSLQYIEEQIKLLKERGKDYNGWLEVRDIISNSKDIEKPTGKLYKVLLHKGKTPDQYTWLEWDKPLSKQSEKTKAALEKQFSLPSFDADFATAGDFYKSRASRYNSDRKASEELLELGIDGIKYPAESISKGRTSETSRGFNYVVFDENAVTIEDVQTFKNGGHIRFEEGGEVENLISQGIVELSMFETDPKHAKEYGFESKKPLFIQRIYIDKDNRQKGIGSMVLSYIIDYAIKNEHDVIFGNITQKAEPNIDVIKSMLIKSGYNTCEGNNDFYKILTDTKYESNNLKKTFAKGGIVSRSRMNIPNVRGGWTKEKIIKYFKSYGSDTTSTYTLVKYISEFDNWQQFKDHIFYHGTQNYIDKGLKPSITMSERDAERYGGGGYGQRYFGISLTKRKRIAESFAGMSRSVTIYPVILKKDAKVIERTDLEDASEIEDIIVELYEQGVDAVWIGGGEEELVVVNPYSVLLYKNGAEIHQVFGGFKSIPLTDEKIKEIYDNSIVLWEKYSQEYKTKNNKEEKEQFLNSLPRIKFAKGGTTETLLAPNGQPSNLTPDQYRLVRTMEFKNWFGDWENDPENASKVVDENGEPLVCHHGTFREFNVFEISKDTGFYFTEFKRIGEIYATYVREGKMTDNPNDTPIVLSCFLNIKNISIETIYGIVGKNLGRINKAKKKGYDGLLLKGGQDVGGYYDQYVAFEPNQIKLADGSNTTFDPNNPDIRFADGGQTPSDFSKVASASSRFRPKETINFDPPLVGTNGAKLISYTWRYEWTMLPNWEGELVEKRVSDWSQAENSAETGRDIVHVYDVMMPDGSVKSVSSESVPVLLGFVEKSQAKVFGSLATASKTLAKQLLKLSIMEAQNKEYDELRYALEKSKKPEIELASPDEYPFISKRHYYDSMKEYGFVDFVYYKMGDEVYREYISGINFYPDSLDKQKDKYLNYIKNAKPNRETVEQLTYSWISNEIKKAGVKKPYGLNDLKNKVERQKRKVERMLQDQKLEDGGFINENKNQIMDNEKTISLPDTYASESSLKRVLSEQGYELSKNDTNTTEEVNKGITISDVAKKHSVPVETLRDELNEGIKVEMEHYKNPEKSKKIALDHLMENPKFYKYLEKMEAKMNQEAIDNHYVELVGRFAKGGKISDAYSFKTPTGQKSRLEYLQQVLVRTTGFKNWFGDWQKAAANYLADNGNNIEKHYEGISKVIDFATLEPKLVFHGTRVAEEFYQFDVSMDAGMGRPYGYFADNQEYSQNFLHSSQRGQGDGEGFLYKCFLNIKKPFMAITSSFYGLRKNYEYWLDLIATTVHYDRPELSLEEIKQEVNDNLKPYFKEVFVDLDYELPFWRAMSADKESIFKRYLLLNKYDGIRYAEEYQSNYDITNPAEFTEAWTIFSPKQVKLGDGRNIEFNPFEVDIRMKNGGKLENPQPEIIEMQHQSKSEKMRAEMGMEIEPMNKFGDGGSVYGDGAHTRDAKDGGFFKGKSHADGGIKAVNIDTGQIIEVEGNEVIINKRSVADQTKREFEGEMLTNKEILSRINQMGGGVKFEKGGNTAENCGCSGKKYKFGGEILEDYIILARISKMSDNSPTPKEQGIRQLDELIKRIYE